MVGSSRRQELEERHWRLLRVELGRVLCRNVVAVKCGGGRRRIRNDELGVCDPVGGKSGTTRKDGTYRWAKIFRARPLQLSERRIIAEEQEQEDHQET